MKKIFLFLAIFMCFKISLAGHLIGGEMSYRFLENYNYEVTLKLYRDCFSGQSPYDDPTNIFVFNVSGNLVATLPIAFTGSDTFSLSSNCSEPIPPGICVEMALFIDTVHLAPTPGGYTMVYQRCCHTSTIGNLLAPDMTGTSFTAFIPDSSVVSKNNSPVFASEPPFVVCYNVPINHDHSANDIDYDLLVYELCSAVSGASPDNVYPNPPLPPPYADVVYTAPYSASDPMPANPNLAIDPATGMLTGTPAAIGAYTLSICVNEYRNGILLGVHRREFVLNVIEGNPNTAEEVQQTNSISIFPNPASEFVQVKSGNHLDEIREIKLFNQLGETIKAIAPLSNAAEINIDLHDLPGGIYCMNVVSNQRTCTRTLLISR